MDLSTQCHIFRELVLKKEGEHRQNRERAKRSRKNRTKANLRNAAVCVCVCITTSVEGLRTAPPQTYSARERPESEAR